MISQCKKCGTTIIGNIKNKCPFCNEIQDRTKVGPKRPFRMKNYNPKFFRLDEIPIGEIDGDIIEEDFYTIYCNVCSNKRNLVFQNKEVWKCRTCFIV